MSSSASTPRELTMYQRLSDFCDDWDLPKVHLRAHETPVRCWVADGIAHVLIHRYSTTETRTQLRFVKSGYRLRSWRDTEDGWIENEPGCTIWDDEFVPFAANLYDSRTPDARLDAERWAALCHRPGNEANPMHSFERVAQCDPRLTTKAMARHWGLNLDGAED